MRAWSSIPLFLRWCYALLISAAVMLTALILCAASVGLVGGEVRAARKAAAGTARTQLDFQANLGPVSCAVARLAAKFLPVEPEVRQGLRALQGVQVSVQEWKGAAPEAGRALAAADETMAGRGWERVTGVVSDENVVAVYARPQDCSPRHAAFTTVVMTEDHLITVRVDGDLGALRDLAVSRLALRGLSARAADGKLAQAKSDAGSDEDGPPVL